MFAHDYDPDPRSMWRLRAEEDNQKATQSFEALLKAARKDLGVEKLSDNAAKEILKMPEPAKDGIVADTAEHASGAKRL